MILYLRDVGNEEVYELNVEASEPIISVMKQIYERAPFSRILPCCQRLSYNGLPLEPPFSLRDYEIKGNSTLQLRRRIVVDQVVAHENFLTACTIRPLTENISLKPKIILRFGESFLEPCPFAGYGCVAECPRRPCAIDVSWYMNCS